MVVSNFTQKLTLAYFSKNDPWAPRSHYVKFETNSMDTRLNNYGLISSRSMLIYHLKLKSAVARIAKTTIFSTPGGLRNH